MQKTITHLASQILTMIDAPTTAPALVKAFGGAFTGEAIEAALDELTPALATCDEDGAGVVYYYRRDTEAERARAAKWNDLARAADRALAEAVAAANKAHVEAIVAADAVDAAADPMAAIKGAVVA